VEVAGLFDIEGGEDVDVDIVEEDGVEEVLEGVIVSRTRQ
jgi:hypothetical protein